MPATRRGGLTWTSRRLLPRGPTPAPTACRAHGRSCRPSGHQVGLVGRELLFSDGTRVAEGDQLGELVSSAQYRRGSIRHKRSIIETRHSVFNHEWLDLC